MHVSVMWPTYNEAETLTGLRFILASDFFSHG